MTHSHGPCITSDLSIIAAALGRSSDARIRSAAAAGQARALLVDLMAAVAGRRRGRESVGAAAHGDARWALGCLEHVVATLEVAPELPPLGAFAARHVVLRHAERKHVHVEARLAALESRCDQAPDLVDHRIGHGKAADRGTGA